MREWIITLYWIAFVLDILSGLIWILTSSFIIPIAVAILTIVMLTLHIKNYRSFRSTGRVRKKLLFWQSTIGILLALCFASIVFFFASLDCLDTCNYPKNHWLTSGVPSALVVFVIATSLAITPHFLLRKMNAVAT